MELGGRRDSRDRGNMTHGRRRSRKSKRRNRDQETQRVLQIGFLNIQGGRRKGKWEELVEEMEMSNLDIMGVTETHLKEEETIPRQTGWVWKGNNRDKGEKKGGGIGVLHKESLKCEVVRSCKEHMWCNVETELGEILMGVAYLATGNNRETENWNDNIIRCIQKDIMELKGWQDVTGRYFVLGGDLNAHISELAEKENRNGRLLKTLVERNGLEIGNLSDKCEGRTTWQRGEQSSTIDYILLDANTVSKMQKIEIDEAGTWSVDSDHNRIAVSLRLGAGGKNMEKEEISRKQVWDWDEVKLENFHKEMERVCESTVDEDWNYEKLIKSIETAALETLSKKNIGGQKEKNLKKWWNKEIKELIQERKEANRRHRKATTEKRTVEEIKECWKIYLEKKDQVKIKVAGSIAEMYRKTENEIKNAGKDAGKKFWKYIKDKNKSKRKEKIILTNNIGEEITEDLEIQRMIIEHMTKEQDSKKRGEKTRQEENEPVERRGDATGNLRAKITQQELDVTINWMKKGKAVGPDKIPNEFIRALGKNARTALLTILNKIMETNEIPQAWKQARIRLVYKGKNKNATDLDSYRPVAVTDGIYKVYMKILKDRLDTFLEENKKIGEAQSGFRKGRQIGDNLFTITNIIEIARKREQKLALAFLDINKAYDGVHREQLWTEMRKIGIEDGLIEHVKEIYQDSHYIYQLQETITKPWKSEIGLKQGCPLSTTLFVIYLENLHKKLIATGKGYKVPKVEGDTILDTENRTIPAVFQADDIVLISVEEEMQELLNCCSEFGKECNVTFGEKKCNIMFFGTDEIQDKPTYVLQGWNMAETECYKYLGIYISNKEDYLEEMEHVLLKKARKWKGITIHTAVFAYNKYEIGRAVWKAMAVPSLTYGNEVATYNKQTLSQLERAQREVGRTILGGNWLTPNVAIQGELGWSTMTAREAKSKLKYKGRLIYMEEERYPKVVYDYIRFSGIQTRWTKRVRQLDNMFGKDSLRRTNTNYKNWAVEVVKDVERNQEILWRKEKDKKKSLNWYVGKSKPEREQIYGNDRGSALLFQARVGALPTAGRIARVFQEMEVNCQLCDMATPENIQHIFLECPFIGTNELARKARERKIELPEILGIDRERTGWMLDNTKKILLFWDKEKKNRTRAEL